jgi:glycosyltransferase involved in cell wall biosynthesis
MTTRLTLVVAVYNKSEDLRLIFSALARQSFNDFEVIIADDGSGKEIADVVNEAKRQYSLRIKHLWHADKGWRKNTMLNYAIQEANTGYIVFIDGDCIPSKRFIEDHYTQREEGKVLLGRRVEHGERWRKTLTVGKITSGAFEKYTAEDIIDVIKGTSVRLEHGIRIPFAFLRTLTEKSDNMLGCNFSTFRKHLIDVNGFDEDYDGPGSGEDSDIFYRLNLIGVMGKSVRNLAIQYHLWHPLTKTSERNYRRFLEMQARGLPQCKNGLKKLGK